MTDIKERPVLTQLAIKFLCLSVREQVLILLTGIGIVGWLVFVLLLEPSFTAKQSIEKKVTSALALQQKLQGQVAEISQQFSQDPNAPVKQKIALLEQQLTELEEQLATKTKNLVPPEQMVAMLESVLSADEQITLVSLGSIAPTPIFLRAQTEQQPAKADLHRHGVSITVRGEYFAIQSYLARLESLRWEFFWKTFDYQVADYPTGEMQFEIYTLSTSPAFIGL